MSRPRQYDREKVLASITNLFWEKGFDATSINEIVTHTRVNKFSIYNEFGDKEKLFQACINHYIKNSSSFVVEILSKKPLGIRNIEEFFKHKLRYARLQADKGCLIFNSVIENGRLSDETNMQINHYISDMIVLFYNCLKAAQNKKEISAEKECKVLANYLACFTFGLVNIGMKQSSDAELRKMVDVTILMVKG